MLKFPKNFKFGAAISAMQTEGKGTTEIGELAFDKFFEANPEKFHNKIGPSVTSDFMRHYKEDLKMLADINVESIRTGFSWARLFPDGKTLNKEAVKFYHDLIAEMKKNKIQIIMTLFHFDMPQWAQEQGAWESREVIEKFVNYANFVFEEYKNEVELWVTFNEPLVPVFAGYLGDWHPPAVNDYKAAINQAFGIFLAHSKVVKLFNSKKIKDGKIGVVFDWKMAYPEDESKKNLEALKIYNAYVNTGPLQIMVDGTIDEVLVSTLKEFNCLPKYTKEELKIISETKTNFLGINYYAPARVKAKENNQARFALDLVETFIPKDAKMNTHRGWEIYPEALYDIAMYIKNNFKNIPWYIAENGMGVENEEKYMNESGIVQDDYRIEFYQEHLEALLKGIHEGSNCFAYHVWAAIDNWSFRNAYKNRYGLLGINLKDQKRFYKKSSFWFKELVNSKE